MEECRAETVALYCKLFHRLSLNIFNEYNTVASNLDILKIFKVSRQLHFESECRIEE